MPYADPARRRAVQADSQRRRRASTPRQPVTAHAALRLETARDALRALADELDDVRVRLPRGTAERARVVGYLCGVALRAVEVVDLTQRLEAIEAKLASREPIQ